MKNILFVCYGLGLGGIEKCLVNLVNYLPVSKFNIDILLMNPEYELKNDIINNVNFLDSYEFVMNTTDTMNEIKERGGVIKNFRKFISYCCFRFDVKLKKQKVWKHFRPLPKKYDVAIAYSQNDYSPYYVIDKVIADRKVLWYHNGAYEKVGQAFEIDRYYYSLFDYIVAVSNDCANVLNRKFEFGSNKVIVLRNICDIENILNKSDAFVPNKYKINAIHITTVGRLTKEKGADLAFNTCKLLRENDYNVVWHWVGDGNQRDKLIDLIAQHGYDDIFILEGNQDNPYPYIKNTDIYVQTSYYEAYSTTITEAKVLQKPIVTTDVGGMRDQIVDGENGLLSKIDSNDLYRKIAMIIDKRNLLQLFKNNLCINNVDNDISLKRYYDTIFK